MDEEMFLADTCEKPHYLYSTDAGALQISDEVADFTQLYDTSSSSHQR